MHKRIIGLVLLLVCMTDLYAQHGGPSLAQSFLMQAKQTNSADSLIYFASKGLVASTRLTEKELALYYLGRGYIDKEDYLKAEQYLDLATSSCNENHNQILSGLLYLEKGRCQQLKNEYVPALVNLLKGEGIIERENQNEGIVRSAIYLAEYYRMTAKYSDAVKFIHKAIGLANGRILEDHLRIQLYNRAAAIMSETANIDSSFYYSFLALHLSERTNNLNQQATSLNEIAYMLENTHQLHQALNKYKQAEVLWSKCNASRYYISVKENEARVYNKLNNFSKSNEILMEIIDSVKARNWISNLQTIYGLMEINYAKAGDMELSYYYKALSGAAKFEVYKSDNSRELELIKTRYETEKKEILLLKQKKEIALANQEFIIQKQQTQVLWYSFLILIVLFLLISYLVVLRSRINRHLKIRNEEIEKTNETLRKNLNQIESLMQEVHHRVKNNLQFIYSIIELEIDSNKTGAKMDSLVDMQRRIMAMSLVHELLYSKDQLEKVSAQKYVHDLVDFLNDIINTVERRVEFKLEIEEIFFDTSKCIAIGMILSELVANSFKHAFRMQPHPAISIKISSPSSGRIRLTLEDNGDGFSEKGLSESGLGLRLIRIFTNQLNGQYTIDGRERFLFIFEFPANE